MSLANAKSDKLAKHALDGVKEYYRRIDFYTTYARESAHFIAELESCCEELREAMAERDYGTIVDRCFQIIEILCVVMREGCLATGQQTPIEARLFKYFESSNHWSPTGAELVVEWYYRILPEIYRNH